MLSKFEAQKRADQVKAFQDELAQLESDAVLSLKNDLSSGPRLVGYFKSLSNKTVHVPLQHHEVLEAVVAEGAHREHYDPPRFEAIINIGQRLEPWVVRVKRLEGE